MKHPLDMTSEELVSMPLIRKTIAGFRIVIYQPDIELYKGYFAITVILGKSLLICNSMITYEGVQDNELLAHLIKQRVDQYKANEIIDLRIDREN